MNNFSGVVSVILIEGKGKCLVTDIPFLYGQLVFSEAPLFLSNSVSDLFSRIVEISSEIDMLEFQPIWYNAALTSLMSNDAEKTEQFITKWFPRDDNTSESATLLDALRLMEKENLAMLTPKAVRDAVLIWRYNSFAHHSDTNALIMYNMTSFMSHSCKPSCVWAFGDGDTFNLRTCRELKVGDELTISYISEDQLTMPIILRRKLLEGWKFHCLCERCSPVDDNLRSLRCPTCNFGELYLSSHASPQSPGTVRACDACGSQISPEELKRLVEVEELYFQRLSAMDATNVADVLNVYNEATRLFTTNHWIIYKLETMMIPHLKQQMSGLGLTFMHNKIKYLERLGFPTYSLGWAYEEVGDWLVATSSEISSNETIARSFFEKAYWVLRTITGSESGYSVSIQSKWANLCQNH